MIFGVVLSWQWLGMLGIGKMAWVWRKMELDLKVFEVEGYLAVIDFRTTCSKSYALKYR